MKQRLSAQQLRELLRSADPLLDDDGPREVDAARMRRATLAEVQPPAKSRRLAPALVAAILVLLALHAGFTWLETRTRDSDPSGLAATRGRSAAPAPAAAETGRRQQVQFVTANGTRVIWVLSSDLSL